MSSSPCYVTEILTPYLKTCPITTQPTHFFNKTVQQLTLHCVVCN